MPIGTYDVNTIFRHVAAPMGQAGARYSQSPNTAEGWAVMAYNVPAEVPFHKSN